MRWIEIRGARVNNLKSLCCKIPHDRLTVITGPSGSGKSSLAFDTLYAEGQRRYIESMSAYARQFLERIQKPDVEHISHILPAIALEQKNRVKNARSTVGTATDVDDLLRLWFARLGQTHCHHCGGQRVQLVTADTVSNLLAESLQQTERGSLRLVITAPVRLSVDCTLADLVEKGFFRYQDQAGALTEFSADPTSVPEPIRDGTEPLAVVIDRLALKRSASGVLDTGTRQRLREAVDSAFRLTKGRVTLWNVSQENSSPQPEAEPTVRPMQTFQQGYSCPDCGATHKAPTPELFSFNHPTGACPTCEGFGRIMGLDMDRVIPNKELSLSGGAIHPFTTPANQELQAMLEQEARQQGVRLNVPYRELTDEERQFVMNGGGGQYPGIRPFFEWLESKRYKVHVRMTLARYRGFYECPDCQGARIRPEGLRVYFRGKHYADLQQMPSHALLHFFESLALSETEQAIAHRLLPDILSRLRYLNQVGLGYLTLGRASRTLSGGESQRIHLAAALGTMLTDTLYVLDEPTVGLHARDTDRLLQVLKSLRDHGNTLVVVEHDPDVIRGADHLIDIGPGSGEQGGRIVYEGDVAGLLTTGYSATACYLRGESLPQGLVSQPRPASPASAPVVIRRAQGNNLQGVTATIPSGQLVCVTGVSGSGKSTLIKQTLFALYEQSQSRLPSETPAPCDAIEGLEQFAEVILVDQSPPGRSLRSNPVTYVKAYDDIRTLLAQTRQAQTQGITASDFSFNTVGGRCETCEGLGTVTVDMQFMADVEMVCPDCHGKRFTPGVLAIEWMEKNIFDILQLTVASALEFFQTQPKIVRKLQPLVNIGLGYLRLGQSTATLSGGEAQRLKLCSYLQSAAPAEPKAVRGKTANKAVTVAQQPNLFLFDEPTTGLHMADVDVLMGAFRQLIAAGHSVVVIEHNLDVIAQADTVLDLGPGGGEQGGQLVFCGSVAALCQDQNSVTGAYLQKHLQARQGCAAPVG
ncbi:MAG: excinuclease ABC subunit UvrA [Candidatus Melainabacteria bacterium]|nr:excinuclease ABC subunit UvrA [Candidatus Melainabacteria bacterium]